MFQGVKKKKTGVIFFWEEPIVKSATSYYGTHVQQMPIKNHTKVPMSIIKKPEKKTAQSYYLSEVKPVSFDYQMLLPRRRHVKFICLEVNPLSFKESFQQFCLDQMSVAFS